MLCLGAGSPWIISVFARHGVKHLDSKPLLFLPTLCFHWRPSPPWGWRSWVQAALLEGLGRSWIWCQKVSSAGGNGTWRIQQWGSGECLPHPDLRWKTNSLVSCELLFFMTGLAGKVLMSWEKGHLKPNSCQKFLWIVVFLVWKVDLVSVVAGRECWETILMGLCCYFVFHQRCLVFLGLPCPDRNISETKIFFFFSLPSCSPPLLAGYSTPELCHWLCTCSCWEVYGWLIIWIKLLPVTVIQETSVQWA